MSKDNLKTPYQLGVTIHCPIIWNYTNVQRTSTD